MKCKRWQTGEDHLEKAVNGAKINRTGKRQNEPPISYVQEMGGSSYAGIMILQRVS